ncbi:MAG TPA: DNA polymerase III subunit chi [Alphaproteobacteria bacterium]|nr:DNA polymerase III subunit chi [Alphaproteobacteria bacterium]
MLEIRFYHLMTGTPTQALFQILSKAVSQSRRTVVRTPDHPSCERLTQDLWTISVDRFLPHGNAKDGDPMLQPVWITSEEDNPNDARILILMEGARAPAIPEGFELMCTIFDGQNEESVHAARTQWKTYKDTYAANESVSLTYWQQTPTGEWAKKA